MFEKNFRRTLLSWFDANKRELPWRDNPSPYAVCVSEFMLQQTTVSVVIPYFQKFMQRFPSWQDLAKATEEEVMCFWQGLGYYKRARHLHQCAKLAAQTSFSSCVDDLLKFPGIGAYTANAIAAIAFGKDVVPVDGNVIRVLSRFLALKTSLPFLKKEIEDLVMSLKGERSGDFAQSLMELGAIVCRPKNPTCQLCPIQKTCKGKENPMLYPQKQEKAPKPQKKGYVYCLFHANGDLWIEKNTTQNLLHGLYGCPTSPWTENTPDLNPFTLDSWTPLNEYVFHVFTHFSLTLFLMCAKTKHTPNRDGVWVNNLQPYPFSILMKKVIKRALESF